MNFVSPLEVISIYRDLVLHLLSQTKMLKTKWKGISALRKSRLPMDDKGSTYVLFQQTK